MTDYVHIFEIHPDFEQLPCRECGEPRWVHVSFQAGPNGRLDRLPFCKRHAPAVKHLPNERVYVP